MRKIVAIAIAFIPFNIIRIFLYRNLLNYKITYKSIVKPFNYLMCNNLTIEENAGFFGYFNIVSNVNYIKIGKGSTIKDLNRFRSFNNCELKSDVTIRSKNVFFGTFNDSSPFKLKENLNIGKNSIITSGHSFDLSDSISIGIDVTIGGSDTQFWTHGFDLEHTHVQSSIQIHDHCYMGSRSMVLPGVRICDYVSIGAGTTISKSITESGFYTSADLIKKAELTYFKANDNVVEYKGAFYYRK